MSGETTDARKRRLEREAEALADQRESSGRCPYGDCGICTDAFDEGADCD